MAHSMPASKHVARVRSSTPEAIRAAAAELDLGPRALLTVLVAEKGAPDLEGIVAALRDLDVEFFGGLFPGLIEGQSHVDEGALLIVQPSDTPPLLITGLHDADFEIPAIEPLDTTAFGTQTAFVLVDGLTANVSRLLAELHGRLGNTVHYVGGGAGSLSLVQRPCVFTRNGVYQDAAVVGFVARQSRFGVRHGWKQLAGPIVATRSHGNVVQELNWRNAYEVYAETIQPYLDEALTEDGFFDATKGFPFGIFKEGLEDVVRDPIAKGANGELLCVGEVPENAVLNILRGDRTSLIEAAALAAKDCLVGDPPTDPSVFVVDCVSRTLFLEDDFERELAVVGEHVAELGASAVPLGILSLGEISSHGQGLVEFFNKTIVIAVLHG